MLRNKLISEGFEILVGSRPTMSTGKFDSVYLLLKEIAIFQIWCKFEWYKQAKKNELNNFKEPTD